MTHSEASWSRDAIREVGAIVERQRSIAFPLAATLGTYCPIWFVDERRKFSGSHKVHLVAARLDAAIRSGRVGARTPLVIDSCGTTALTLASMVNAIGARCRVYCPRSTAMVKLRYLRQLGAEITLVASLDAARTAAREACAGGSAVHIDQFSAPRGDEHIPDGFGTSLFDAMETASGATPSDVLTCVGSGGTLLSLRRAVADRAAPTTVRVVDLPDGQFASRRRGPGHSIDGLNQEFLPECLAEGGCENLVTASEGQAFAAAIAMHEVYGERIGITSGLVLAGAIALRAQMDRDGRKGLVCVPIYDTGERYAHKLMNRDFLDAFGEEYAEALGRFTALLRSERNELAA